MKILSIFIVVLAAATGCSRSFEGTIELSTSTRITDPEMKEQLESPLIPEDLRESMAVTTTTLKLGGGNVLTTVDGGFKNKTEILYLSGNDTMYLIDHPSKTYLAIGRPEKSGLRSTFTKTSETNQILDYTCTRYIIETSDPDGNPVTINSWVTTEIGDAGLTSAVRDMMDINRALTFIDIEGTPLKTEMITPVATLVVEVTGIHSETQPASIFALPVGYVEEKI